MTTYNDNTLMPFGQHKGTKLANVPASYLLWLYGMGCNNLALMKYIQENLQGLRQEAKINSKLQKK